MFLIVINVVVIVIIVVVAATKNGYSRTVVDLEDSSRTKKYWRVWLDFGLDNNWPWPWHWWPRRFGP